MMKDVSIRRRLITWISVPALVSALLIFFFVFLSCWHEIEEVYDAQLVHSAKTLLQISEKAVIRDDDARVILGDEEADPKHEYERNTGYRIWLKDRVVTQSSFADSFPVIETPGFANVVINGQKWRFFRLDDPHKNMRIETFEKLEIRYELIIQIIFSVMTPLILFFPVMAVAIWKGSTKGLEPLTELSADMDLRNANDLTAISDVHAPREIKPLTGAINHLMARLEESFRHEREFTDHAAHELRTPLAALKTRTQVMARKFADREDAPAQFADLNGIIDRASNLVDKLLSMARLQNSSFDLARMDLSEKVMEQVIVFQTLAEQKNIIFDVSVEPNIFVMADNAGISLMIGNLLENALKYAPVQSHIKVSLSQNGNLEIADQGPGIADTEKQKVFGRFYRIQGTTAQGSGLGLAIVKWIADVHGIKIKLKDVRPTGLAVQCDFTSLIE